MRPELADIGKFIKSSPKAISLIDTITDIGYSCNTAAQGDSKVVLTWQKANDGEWIATRDGRTVFSIEKRRGGYGLRRWSVRRDGTQDMCGVEIVRSVQEAKAYANNLSKE